MLAGLMAGILLLGQPAAARDARETGDWLCSRVFEGDGAALAMTCDGFFGLVMLEAGKPEQNMTGMWKLAGDGVELTLFNRQDAEIHVTVGAAALHASLGGRAQVSLSPGRMRAAAVTAVGLIERSGKGETFTDAASGRTFPVKAPEAANGKFATVELKIGPGGVEAGTVISHSGSVPRFFRKPEPMQGAKAFETAVAGRYWLLPELPDVPRCALRLAPPDKAKAGKTGGLFEVSGPGLRLEGAYALQGCKLTLTASHASVRNIKLMGAGALLDALKGPLDWQVSPRGLEITGQRRLLLLPSGS